MVVVVNQSIFGQKTDPKPPRSHFLPKPIHQNKFQLKILILSKNDGSATLVQTCLQISLMWACSKYIQRYKNHFGLTQQCYWGLVIRSWEQCYLIDCSIRAACKARGCVPSGFKSSSINWKEKELRVKIKYKHKKFFKILITSSNLCQLLRLSISCK